MCFIQLKAALDVNILTKLESVRLTQRKQDWGSNTQIIPSCKHLSLTHSGLAAPSMLQSSAAQASTRLSNSINVS